MSAGKNEIDENVVTTLINLANAAKGAYQSKNSNNNGNKSNNEPKSPNSSLKQLFRAKHRGESDCSSNSNQSSLRSVWDQPPKSKYMKNQKSSKGKQKAVKIVEMVKDVFFVPRPDICTVPRRNNRPDYYLNNLVATAVKFSSDMDENDIRNEIMGFFPQYPKFVFPNFDFVKVVVESLVIPNIKGNWDFQTLKHVCGQGPIYIRSVDPLVLKYDFFPNERPVESDTEDEEEKDKVQNQVADKNKDDKDDTWAKIDYLKPTKGLKSAKKNLTKTNETAHTSTKDVKNEPERKNEPKDVKNEPERKNEPIDDESPSCSKAPIRHQSLLMDFYGESIQCPICHLNFPSKVIESHAAYCQPDNVEESNNFYVIPSDDDMDVTIAYQAEDDNVVVADKTEEASKPVEELIKVLKVEIKDEAKSLNIRRRRCWEDFQLCLKKSWINSCGSYRITFVGEAGIDTGGPKREFFTVCLEQMARQVFYYGMPVSSVMLISQNVYYMAGRLMANTLLQGGPNPNILSPLCFDLISSKTNSISPTDIEIPNEFLERSDVKKLLSCNSDEMFRKQLLEDAFMDILGLIGYIGVPSNEKLSAREGILKSWFYKVKIEPIIPALQQIQDGLNFKGLLQSIKQNQHSFKEVFTEKLNITYEEISDLMVPVFSEEGSNKKLLETDIYKFFTDYLENCHYAENPSTTMADILKFLTGTPSIPALGFGRKIAVQFNHDCELRCRCRAVTSTCALILTLSVHWDEYAAFSEMMEESINSSLGFDRV